MGGLTSGSWKKDCIPWNKGLKGVQKSKRKGISLKDEYGIKKAKQIQEKIKLGWTKERKIKTSKRTQKQWENIEFRNKIIKAVSKANKNRKVSIETRKKLSKATKGKNNPRYIDDRTNKWRKVRKQCFERDNYICKLCNKRGTVYLNAHHIINRHICKDKFDINNLITLCKSCHMSMTNIEQTDSYNEYKVIFSLYVQKINLKGENL